MQVYATCDCGWQCQGSESDVVEELRAHGVGAHGIELSEAQVLAVSKPVTPQPTEGTP